MNLEELIAVRDSALEAYKRSYSSTTIRGGTAHEEEAYNQYVEAVVAVKKALAAD